LDFVHYLIEIRYSKTQNFGDWLLLIPSEKVHYVWLWLICPNQKRLCPSAFWLTTEREPVSETSCFQKLHFYFKMGEDSFVQRWQCLWQWWCCKIANFETNSVFRTEVSTSQSIPRLLVVPILRYVPLHLFLVHTRTLSGDKIRP
jgi:hypothetical protein